MCLIRREQARTPALPGHRLGFRTRLLCRSSQVLDVRRWLQSPSPRLRTGPRGTTYHRGLVGCKRQLACEDEGESQPVVSTSVRRAGGPFNCHCFHRQSVYEWVWQCRACMYVSLYTCLYVRHCSGCYDYYHSYCYCYHYHSRHCH